VSPERETDKNKRYTKKQTKLRGGANTVSVGGRQWIQLACIYGIQIQKRGELVLRTAVVSQRVEAAACVSCQEIDK